MQDEPTPEELTSAVADFLRNDIAPVFGGHNAFKLRVAINALDLVTRLAPGGDGPVSICRSRKYPRSSAVDQTRQSGWLPNRYGLASDQRHHA